MSILRHAISIAILPGTVTVGVPMWLARQNGTAFAWPATGADVLLGAVGVVCLAVGLWLFLWSLYYFWSRGDGTLAPWDPPRRFVVAGPYQYVRNPMISGVIFVLCGEAGVLRSWPHAQWAGIFFLMNLVWIPLIEEPMLAARFGEPYVRYKRAVRMFIPRVRPYR